MAETAKERWERTQREAAEALAAYQAEMNPPIGPDTKVIVSRTVESYKEMTLAVLAHQLRVPLKDLIFEGHSIKNAGNVVEEHAEMMDWSNATQETDFWSVAEVR